MNIGKELREKMDLLELARPNLRCLNVVVAKDQISSDLGEEVVILNLRTGVYHGLNAVGARIWNLLQESRTVKDIKDVILNEYDVEPDCCESDLLVLLQKLADEGLIEVRNETAA